MEVSSLKEWTYRILLNNSTTPSGRFIFFFEFYNIGIVFFTDHVK